MHVKLSLFQEEIQENCTSHPELDGKFLIIKIYF